MSGDRVSRKWKRAQAKEPWQQNTLLGESQCSIINEQLNVKWQHDVCQSTLRVLRMSRKMQYETQRTPQIKITQEKHYLSCLYESVLEFKNLHWWSTQIRDLTQNCLFSRTRTCTLMTQCQRIHAPAVKVGVLTPPFLITDKAPLAFTDLRIVVFFQRQLRSLEPLLWLHSEKWLKTLAAKVTAGLVHYERTKADDDDAILFFCGQGNRKGILVQEKLSFVNTLWMRMLELTHKYHQLLQSACMFNMKHNNYLHSFRNSLAVVHSTTWHTCSNFKGTRTKKPFGLSALSSLNDIDLISEEWCTSSTHLRWTGRA